MPFGLSQFALGRLAHNEAWLAGLPSHEPAHASVVVIGGPRFTPTLVDNLTLPTCTVAGLINSARLWALTKGYDLWKSDASLVSFYALLAGCDDTPAAIAQTEGLTLQAVLEAAQKGWFTAGEQAPLVPEFRAIRDPAHIPDVIARFGSAYLGIMLYEGDVQPGAEWRGPPVGAPYGRHCVVVYADGIATWGETMPYDAEFLATRLDEAHAVQWMMETA